MLNSSSTRKRNSPLLYCSSQFIRDINDTSIIINELQKYRIEIRKGKHIHLDNRTIELYICLYFLRIHLSWESFLESTFVRYICGHPNISGKSPTLLIPRQTSISFAMSTILGPKNFLSWSPDETIVRSQKYLHMGEPYSRAMSVAKNDLKNLYTIRNRIAHSSEYAQNMFRQTVRTEIGYNPKGMTPGRFLLMKKPISSRKKVTYLHYYLDILQTLANQIVS